MDAERNEKTGESTTQGTQEPTQETPQSKLRDLRPEKDPMGAGRDSVPEDRQKESIVEASERLFVSQDQYPASSLSPSSDGIAECATL